ncbi:hypothetical protein BCV70DRAFT_105002 [Testicularia cyperi]|uniref:Uncharacterized protein n=1 Tax=Testicularia cyperi TaxID=1882483 RepID=A0A317XP82_9BASI|nr:hypothetical protein BCV70DRAFT_105002 [Testicularia cyperi]
MRPSSVVSLQRSFGSIPHLPAALSTNVCPRRLETSGDQGPQPRPCHWHWLWHWLWHGVRILAPLRSIAWPRDRTKKRPSAVARRSPHIERRPRPGEVCTAIGQEARGG